MLDGLTKNRRRIGVFVDASRDTQATEPISHLEPDDRYVTTYNRLPLRLDRIRPCRVLIVAGNMADSYSSKEKKTIVSFVRSGGGLLLAACAGTFERYSGRPASDMAVASIGRLFGIEFLSPPRGRGGKPTEDAALVKGYHHSTVRLLSHPALRGMLPIDVHLDQWSPVRAARRREGILNHRVTREAAAIAVEFGKGRVIAVGETSFLAESRRLLLSFINYLAAGGNRNRAARVVARSFREKLSKRRSGKIEIIYSTETAARVGTVLRIARKVVPRVEQLFVVKKFEKCCITLVATCSQRQPRGWGQGATMSFNLGAEASAPNVAFAIGWAMTFPWAAGPNYPSGRHLADTPLGYRGLSDMVGLIAMREAGFGKEAEALGEALERNSRERFKSRDAGWFYVHASTLSGVFMWRELIRKYGEEIIPRFYKAWPKKYDWSAVPIDYFTSFDNVVYFLSRAARTDLRPWFRELGATFRPLPMAKFPGKEFKRKVRRYLEAVLEDESMPASEKSDALTSLAWWDKADKRTLAHAARQTKSQNAAVRLTGAVRLAKSRDQRGIDALWTLVKIRKELTLAALAALRLAELGDRNAAEPLVKLAAGQDHRFQLEAGYHLAAMGHPGADRYSLSGIAKSDGREAARLEMEYGETTRVYGVLDGHRVANIFSTDRTGHMPYNTHVSLYFVNWVHTGSKFRRKGIARQTLARSLADPRAKRCSCMALFTGTDNVAHALYRSLGFVDVNVNEELNTKLERKAPVLPAKGVTFRPYQPGDEIAMAEVHNKCWADFFAAKPQRPYRRSEEAITLLAHRRGRLVGYVVAGRSEENARIEDIAAIPDKKREDIVKALMSRFHKTLLRRGMKTASWWRRSQEFSGYLQSLGYRSRKTGGISMFGILNLPQFLEEITPLLEKRLTGQDWCGTIALLGQKHRATLEIEKGRVKVIAGVPMRADMTIEGGDPAITRLMAGAQNVFEQSLQLELNVTPLLNGQSQELLTKLFPRMESLDDYW